MKSTKSGRSSVRSPAATGRTVAATESPAPKTAGIKEVAKLVGVSIGTVDRALHSRPGISEATRTKIVQAAEQLGYRPNLAARHLKLGRRRRVSVHLPEEIRSYFDAVRAGVRQAAAQLQPQLDVEFHAYPRMGQGEVASIEAMLEGSCDGLILAPSSLSKIAPLIRKATARGIAVVCVATDAPGTDRLTAVACDPFTSGAIVAELLTRTKKGSGKAAILTGDLATFDHSEKVRGFRSMLSELESPITLVEVAETHDAYREAYRHMRDLLARHADLSAIYVSTANSLPVIQAIEEKGDLCQMTVIVTDLYPELVPMIRKGKVFATLYQRPVTQGRMAFEALHAFLLQGIRPRPMSKLAPYIVMRSNIDLLIESLAIGSDPDRSLREHTNRA